ncbi:MULTISPECIES: type IV pilin protein [Dyella]|uniref:Type IV pilin protein n=2 Tax=Dyella TaxID=231454 RepID=A0A4R0YTG4_9GAMM|nr:MULTISPECIES: type IV pilin protein [Dyella]TBR39753.1 type IV pilin protein [Dyella terrae]TCI12665.1 type IV pilin protein [Dyella soli]
MKRQQGFSLIELMVVVMIIAILVAVALPSYRKYVVRTHRTDAQRALLDLATRQEQYFYSHNAYATAIADLGASSTVQGGLYQITTPIAASSTDYTIVATAVGTQQRDDAPCQSMSMNRAGVQTSTGTTANNPVCWGK